MLCGAIMVADGSNSMERSREFEYDEQDFQAVRKLIYDRAGINLKAGKQEMVYSRLARRLRALKLTSFSVYLQLLTRPDAPEWEAFVNAITTNLTHFFREPHHFPILAKQAQEHQQHRPFRVWSAAASTGEEVYSIAIVLDELFGQLESRCDILASDLDTNVLETARRGVYSLERLESVSHERLRRYFLKGTQQNQGYAKVSDEVRRAIRFENINLMADAWNIDTPFDAIFCRNVMIYFDRETQFKILKKLSRALVPEGRLYVGHSENLFHAKELFQLCEKTVYRRINS